MVAIKRAPAIAGVSPDTEAIVMTVFPSVACTWFGQVLGQLYESIPLRIGGVKLSNLLFVLPTAPAPAFIYLWLKVSGERYVLTNRALQRWRSYGNSRAASVNLSDIDQVVVHQEPGQVFYKAADIYILDKGGNRLMVLSGVPYATIFRQTILEARDAQQQVNSALETIRARG